MKKKIINFFFFMFLHYLFCLELEKMNIKYILKGIFFTTLVSLSLASDYSGDCKEIESYIKKNVKGNVNNYLQSCEVNSSGKLKSL